MDRSPFRIRVSTLLILLAMSPLVLSVMTGLKSYALWDQVTYLWLSQADPLTELVRAHPHALRYALVYPIFAVSDHLDLDPDSIFSILLLLLCFLTIRNLQAITAILTQDQRPPLLVQFAAASVLAMLFFLMNGRIGFAFLGYSMVLLVILRHHHERHFSFGSSSVALLGLALCSVSSGTLVSAVLALAIAVYFEACRCIRRSSFTRPALVIFLAGVALGGLLFRYLVVGINKNITFYGGGSNGILQMLEHGFGRALYPALSAAGLPVVVAIVAVMCVLFGMILFRLRHSLLLHVSLAALACGAFGYSTLTLAAIPLLAAAIALMAKGIAADPAQASPRVSLPRVPT